MAAHQQKHRKKLLSPFKVGFLSMSRSLFAGVVSCLAAWVLFRFAAAQAAAIVPVDRAAEQLREAWASNHTTA